MLVSVRSLCLASTSPRRRAFLQRYGLQFECYSPDVDESEHLNESVEAYVQRVAQDKAKRAQSRYPNAIILAGDTTVFYQGRIVGKPSTPAEACAMLRLLRGQRHQVYSAYVILDSASGELFAETICTEVLFRSYSEECIQWYIQTGEPMDKAGAYSIQGVGTLLVDSIQGSYNNVVGFPVERILPHLLQKGWIRYAPP